MNDTNTIEGDLVKRLVSELITHKENLSVAETQLGAVLALEIQVHQADFPRVCGKGGFRFQSLERLCQLMAKRRGSPISLVLLDSTVGESAKLPPFVVVQDWPKYRFTRLAKDIADTVFEEPCAALAQDTPNGSTHMTIYVSHTERDGLVAAVEALLQPLFKAAGMNNGRRMTLGIEREG